LAHLASVVGSGPLPSQKRADMPAVANPPWRLPAAASAKNNPPNGQDRNLERRGWLRFAGMSAAALRTRRLRAGMMGRTNGPVLAASAYPLQISEVCASSFGPGPASLPT
jgi:hypothetical protein